MSSQMVTISFFVMASARLSSLFSKSGCLFNLRISGRIYTLLGVQVPCREVVNPGKKDVVAYILITFVGGYLPSPLNLNVFSSKL